MGRSRRARAAERSRRSVLVSSGAAGFRRAAHDKERLGARGSAWLWGSAFGGRRASGSVRWASAKGFDRRFQFCSACHTDWLGEWFRDSSQAFGANRRVQRASDAADLFGLELRRMALHSMACRAAAAGVLVCALIYGVAAEASE